MNETLTVYLIHGFLGQAQDWNAVIHPSWRVRAISLFCPQEKNFIGTSSSDWIHSLNEMAASDPAPKLVVGYSLGGRLALQLLLAAPRLWQGGVILSAHPGLPSEEERFERRMKDAQWAQRFLSDPWDQVLRDWNSQEVFQQEVHAAPQRLEQEFSRESLAWAMRHYSLGEQRDLRSELEQLQTSVLWISGERDGKFRALHREVTQLNARFENEVIPQAAHRMIWSHPERLQQLIQGQLEKIF